MWGDSVLVQAAALNPLVGHTELKVWLVDTNCHNSAKIFYKQ